MSKQDLINYLLFAGFIETVGYTSKQSNGYFSHASSVTVFFKRNGSYFITGSKYIGAQDRTADEIIEALEKNYGSK